MLYGLSNSPSVFQNFMNEIVRDMLHHFVIIYIDDILIYSSNFSNHVKHVQQALVRLRQHLYLKLEKCEFHQPTIQFLGYVITPEGIQMDGNQVEAVKSWPQPLTIKDLQRFLGFANFYRRIISGYSEISAPLTSLLHQRPKHICWTPNGVKAFQKLNDTFSTASTLLHPDPTKPYCVEVNASSLVVGAVLSQRGGTSSLLHPCTSQRNYPRRSRTMTLATGNY